MMNQTKPAFTVILFLLKMEVVLNRLQGYKEESQKHTVKEKKIKPKYHQANMKPVEDKT